MGIRSLAVLHLLKNNVHKFTRPIVNKNIMVFGYQNCKFEGSLYNPNNVHIKDSNKIFIRKNINKLVAPNMYFHDMIHDYYSLFLLQGILNHNQINCYINDLYYDKFVNLMYVANRYISGESYCNDKQIFPFNENITINTLYLDMEDIIFKI